MTITAAAAVFGVADLDAALEHDEQVLGFSQEFRVGNYAGIIRVCCLLHLSQSDNPNVPPPGSGSVYVFCEQVDSIYDEIAKARGDTLAPPRDYPFGMRDFAVHDIDGNRLAFGAKTNAMDDR